MVDPSWDYGPSKSGATARKRILDGILGQLPEDLSKHVPREANKQSGNPGGYWPVIGEKQDQRAIKQVSTLACGPAAAEMLLKDRNIVGIQQAQVMQITGTPTTIEHIADALNQLAALEEDGAWVGLTYSGNDEKIWALFNHSGSWIANFQQPGSLGHIVVVVRDPWQGTSYKMEWEEFLKVWTRGGVFWRKQ